MQWLEGETSQQSTSGPQQQRTMANLTAVYSNLMIDMAGESQRCGQVQSPMGDAAWAGAWLAAVLFSSSSTSHGWC
jgi:hypothetical protein